MTKTLTILLFLFISLATNATSQFGDILIQQGDTFALFSNPLELRSNCEGLSKNIIAELEYEDRRLYPEKYEAEAVESMSSTACWRGYLAEWTLINDKIYLSNIYACHNNKVKVDLIKIFGEELKENLLFGNWITDKLVVPLGNCIEYVNLDYKSIYETETIMEFKDGILVTSKTYNNYIARKSKFTSDPNPNNFSKFIYTQINWDKLPDLTNKHIQISIGIQPNPEGKIDSLLSDYTYMLDSSTLIIDRNNIFFKEAIRIAELIPDWDVIYQRGRIVSRNLTIVFDETYKKKYAR